MNKMSVALILSAALLLGPAVGVSAARPGHMSGPHGGIGHPGLGAGAFRMHQSAPFSGYRGRGVQNWAHGSGNFYRHRGRGFAGFYPYYGGYYSYGYGGCAWLYAQAVASGSGYWWQRYYDCVGY